MNIIGLDLSVTASGVCFADTTAVTIKPRTKGDERFREIADRIMTYCQTANVHLAVIEKASGGLKGHADQIYGVQAVVRTELLRASIPYTEVNVSTLKKFATGRGTGVDKSLMAVEAFKRAGVQFFDDNQTDAWWLRLAGEVHYDYEVAQVVMPKAHRDALDSVVWPDVSAELVDAAKHRARDEAVRRAERALYGVESWTGAA